MDNELTMQQVKESDLLAVEGGIGPLAGVAAFVAAHALAAGIAAVGYGIAKLVEKARTRK
jgi:hypothetical protein